MTTIPNSPSHDTVSGPQNPQGFSWLSIGAAYVFAIATWLTVVIILLKQSFPTPP